MIAGSSLWENKGVLEVSGISSSTPDYVKSFRSGIVAEYPFLSSPLSAEDKNGYSATIPDRNDFT